MPHLIALIARARLLMLAAEMRHQITQEPRK
jgi:hypothetical protein